VAAAAQPRKSSSAGWIYAAVAIFALAGGYTVFRSQQQKSDAPTATPPVTTAPTPPPSTAEAPKPTETAAAPAEKTADPSATATADPATAKPTEKEAAEKEAAAAPAKEDRPAGLAVTIGSDPAGAMVTVDGKPLPEPTPTTLSGLDAKKTYDVRLALKGFHEWKVKLKPKAGEKVDAALVPNEKVVEVATTPSGADVVLDGKRVGRTPYTIHKLDLSKSHALEIKRSGFVSQTRSISSSDAFEPKGDKDVLAVAMTLEAEPKTSAPLASDKPAEKKSSSRSTVAKKPAVKKPAAGEAATATDKPAEAAATDKPVEAAAPADKPATADKPAATEKPAADKPTATEKPVADKPASSEKASKVPASTKDKPASNETAPPASETPQQ
jgi:hypothetical protein